MGKLLDRLTRAAEQAGGAPIGFTPAARRARTLAVLARTASGKAAELEAAGVDAVLLESGKPPAKATVPVGVHEPVAGADFLYLRADAPAGALLDSELDRLLEVDPASDDVTLRSLAALDVDAVVFAVPDEDMTVHELARLRRVVIGFAKPAVAAVSGVPGERLLRLVRDIGVIGVLAPLDGAGARTLIDTIEGLPPRRKQRGRNLDPVLPRHLANVE